jgi:quinol monooxygenase YgiN
MQTLTILAKIVAKKDCVESLKNELLRLVAPTRQEEGCIEYRLHQDNDNPAVFLFYENWANAACLDQHMNTARFKAYLAATEDLVAQKTVHRLTGLE